MDAFISILDITSDAVGDDPIHADEEYFGWERGGFARNFHVAATQSADAVVDAPFPVDQEINAGFTGIGGFCIIC
ncbi:hypothetical protein M404DRAFT_1003584 [Pisolithus tinctorius Marx 270]|uniref:Uncharacterized protein n=1 Tax=Pisolithus tinctorius Marx 270 TaxID=870435 RepID=A0A0C3NIT6_PISTI|nr:hypothetical protein M404DRAFT_1003584 [Pisolithus tinctorius Marx 270]